jgi:segregation and condensation protein A
VIDFRVDLNVFRGPMDLLLYLVRKHEVEITDIPISPITDQYLEYLAVIEKLDVNAVGDFLGMASLLIEIKSQQVLPRSDEVEDELEDPRQELVRRLLDYKKYRDAASMLEERGRSWQERYCRLSTDLPRHERDMAGEPIHEVELWDLVSAFGRITRRSTSI